MKRLLCLASLPILLACNNVDDVFDPDLDAPILVSAKTLDLDDDGSVETFQLLFDDQMADETLDESDFSFDPLLGKVRFDFSTNGDQSHNAVIYLSFPDDFYALSTEFELTYTAGTLADTDGNLLADTVIAIQPVEILP